MKTKPWDGLREPVDTPPIQSGRWFTRQDNAAVNVKIAGDRAHVSFREGEPKFDFYDSQYFHARGLREVAEFFNVLADQLEGKAK